MTGIIEAGIGSVSPELARFFSNQLIDRRELLESQRLLNPSYTVELGKSIQITELYNINRTADRIEELFRRKNLPLPKVYALHTAGLPPPFKGDILGNYAEDQPFELLPPTDILGHEGLVKVSEISPGSTYLSFEGRAHPYEWQGSPAGMLIVARQLNIIKELIRRQREKGENPVVILSYLSGVMEGSPLKPGDLGVIIDDSNLGPTFHPGFGPHSVLEKFLGSRFQNKAGRNNLTLAGEFCKLAQSKGIHAGSATIVGTPGETEYQSFFEMELAQASMRLAKKMGLDDLAGAVYPRRKPADWMRYIFTRSLREPSLLFGMGNTFELATMRQIQVRTNPENTENPYIESDIPVLPIALITDSVGKGSQKVSHEKIVAEAFATASRNAELLKDFVHALINGDIKIPLPNRLPPSERPFSLQGTILYGLTQEAEKIVQKVDNYSRLPETYFDVRDYLRKLQESEVALASLHGNWGFAEKANAHNLKSGELKQIQDNLQTKEDGKPAYNYIIQKRNQTLNEMTGISDFDKRKELLTRARFMEKAARLVAQEKGLKHQNLDI